MEESKGKSTLDMNKTSLEKAYKKRITYIDIARGIAIILMIAGHVCTSGWKRNVIFSFHMPLFIIVSGMFFKDENFKDTLKKIIIKLIIPYVIAILISDIIKILVFHQSLDILRIIEQIVLAHSNKRIFFKEIASTGVLWFIPFLALSRLLFYGINKISKNDDLLKGIICLILSTMGIYLAKKQIFLPWSFDIVLSAILFYYIGYMLKKYEVLDKILNNYKIIVLIALLWIIGLKLGPIELAIRSYPYGFICYITAICGTIICFFIANIIEKYLKYTTNILKWFGKNSIYILCFHHLESVIIAYSKFGITQKWQIFIVKLIIVTICTIILTKFVDYIKKLIPQKSSTR